jgi:predicted Zn-dependent protease
MLTAKIDPMAFSDIMNRMMSHMEQSSKNDKNGKEPDEDVLDYLSSHPTTKERVEIAQQYSQCFKKGLTTCEIVLEPQ